MKRLRVERAGRRDEFRFALHGLVDAAGARALDKLFVQCMARDAREVRLDLGGLTEISTQGLAVIQRHAKVYEQTERRIVVEGVRGGVREALVHAGAGVYVSNAAESVPPDAAPAASDGASDPAGTPAAPDSESTARAEGPPDRTPSASKQLRRKIVEFRNLFEITQGLNLARDLDAVLNLFGLSVMGQFGVDRLALFLTDPDREGVLLPRQVRGFAQGHFQDVAIPLAEARALVGDGSFTALDAVATSAPTAAAEPLVGGAPAAAGAGAAQRLLGAGLEWGVALWVRRDLLGVLFVGGRGGRKGFQEDERDLLTILAHQAAVAIVNARFHRQLEERNLGLVRGMMSLIESRDVYARGSTERVVRYVMALARVLQVPQEDVKALIYGAVLRDIGMLAVSHLVLKNPAHLSEEEWSLIRQHPTRGAQILEEMNLPRPVVDVVLNHHERWGGEGYPFGLKGQDIPLGARVVSLVDAYVAMTSERPYRRALPFEKARQVISENWGAPFDPALVEAFLSVLDRMERRSRMRLLDRSGPRPEAAGGPDRASLDPLGSGATIPAAASRDGRADSEDAAPTPADGDAVSMETNP